MPTGGYYFYTLIDDCENESEESVDRTAPTSSSFLLFSLDDGTIIIVVLYLIIRLIVGPPQHAPTR